MIVVANASPYCGAANRAAFFQPLTLAFKGGTRAVPGMKNLWPFIITLLLTSFLYHPNAAAQSNPAPNSFQWAGLFESLQSAAESASVSKTTFGKKPNMGNPFTDIRKDGGFLVGFELTKGDWFGAPLLQSVQPIYFTPKGKDLGQRRGNLGHDPFKIEAKDGYAVSSVKIHQDGSFVFSIQLIFMKIDLVRQTLDPSNSYTSDVYGDVTQHPEWTPDKQLGNSTPIIGLFGYAENYVNVLGVVPAPQAP